MEAGKEKKMRSRSLPLLCLNRIRIPVLSINPLSSPVCFPTHQLRGGQRGVPKTTTEGAVAVRPFYPHPGFSGSRSSPTKSSVKMIVSW